METHGTGQGDAKRAVYREEFLIAEREVRRGHCVSDERDVLTEQEVEEQIRSIKEGDFEFGRLRRDLLQGVVDVGQAGIAARFEPARR